MRVLDLGSAANVRQRWAEFLEQNVEAGVYMTHGHVALPKGRGVIGREAWHTNHMLLLVKGGGSASGGKGAAVAVSEGQLVFWQAGEWYSFEVPEPTPFEGLRAQGDDLNPDVFVRM